MIWGFILGVFLEPRGVFLGDLSSMLFRVFFPRWFLGSVLKRLFAILIVFGVPGEVTFGVFLSKV